MRRISTPKRPNSKDKQFHKVVPLTNLLSTLLTTTSTDFHVLQGSNLSKINNSKYQSPRIKEGFNTFRPQTSSKKVDQFLCERAEKNQLFLGSDSFDRKGLRPRSSATNVGACKIASSRQSHANKEPSSKQQNNFTVRPPTTCESRKYNSLSNQKQVEYKVQYKVVQADSLFDKLIQKAPKSIQSSKSIGFVRGYGVNSHKFYNNTEVCEGRVLIIGNLTKTTKVQAITSLYAIFQSSKSILFVDFVRQHFQIQISKKLDHFPPPLITKQLIQSCLHKIQNKFCEMYNVPIKKNISITVSMTNSFGLSYSMAFIKSDEIIVCTKGQSQAKTSINHGNKLQGQHSQALQIRKICKEEIQSLDFIALISEAKEWEPIKNRISLVTRKPAQPHSMLTISTTVSQHGSKGRFGKFY